MLFHMMYHLIVFKSDKHQKNCAEIHALILTYSLYKVCIWLSACVSVYLTICICVSISNNYTMLATVINTLNNTHEMFHINIYRKTILHKSFIYNLVVHVIPSCQCFAWFMLSSNCYHHIVKICVSPNLTTQIQDLVRLSSLKLTKNKQIQGVSPKLTTQTQDLVRLSSLKLTKNKTNPSTLILNLRSPVC
jgi:hypothetical protein